MERPDDLSVAETAERTRLALERITHGKIKAAQPKHVPKTNSDATYIRYTPANQSADEGKQRIIKMTEVQEDPLEPPRFKHKKIPRGPAEPPPPVLQSPPRAATAQDQKDWMIPPCISNWKNNKGYTIPLDKRLAADGRGLQDVHINDNFAKFSESLYIADRHIREEVRARAQLQQLLAQKQKTSKEEELRLLAQRAREDRSGLSSSVSGSVAAASGSRLPAETGINLGGYGSESGSEEESDEEEEDEDAIRERNIVREEKRREREKKMRMSNMGSEMRAKMLAKSVFRLFHFIVIANLLLNTEKRTEISRKRLLLALPNLLLPRRLCSTPVFSTEKLSLQALPLKTLTISMTSPSLPDHLPPLPSTALQAHRVMTNHLVVVQKKVSKRRCPKTGSSWVMRLEDSKVPKEPKRGKDRSSLRRIPSWHWMDPPIRSVWNNLWMLPEGVVRGLPRTGMKRGGRGRGMNRVTSLGCSIKFIFSIQLLHVFYFLRERKESFHTWGHAFFCHTRTYPPTCIVHHITKLLVTQIKHRRLPWPIFYHSV